MSQTEFSRYRGVSRMTVYRWCQRGNIALDRWGELVDVEKSDRMLDEDRPAVLSRWTGVGETGDRLSLPPALNSPRPAAHLSQQLPQFAQDNDRRRLGFGRNFPLMHAKRPQRGVSHRVQSQQDRLNAIKFAFKPLGLGRTYAAAAAGCEFGTLVRHFYAARIETAPIIVLGFGKSYRPEVTFSTPTRSSICTMLCCSMRFQGVHFSIQ